MSRCDGDTKFPKVYKHARHMLKTLKNPNTGKKLIVDERLNQAIKRVDSKFGGFHLKLIACVRNETTEVLLTSANFHNWHFHYDHSDMVVYFRLPTDDFRESYLEPLGLVAHKFGSLPLMPRDASSNMSSNASESGSINSPSNISAQAFPALTTEGSNKQQQQQQQQPQQNGVAGDVSNSSSGTTTPTTTPRSVTPRSSNRPTPSQTPKQQRVTLATRDSNSTLTNNTQNEVAVINHIDAASPPTQITKTVTTYETDPGSQITKKTTTYETTTTFTSNSLDRKRATPSPRPQAVAPAPPLPPATYNESDDSVDIAIQRYDQVPSRQRIEVSRQYNEVPQPHSNTSTLSRQSEGSRSFHEEAQPSYNQQSTLPARDHEPRAHSYHGSYEHPHSYRHEVSRSYGEARQVDPVFTDVRTASTKKTTPVQRAQEQSSVVERASPVSSFYTELQQVKMRQGPRDQFSHSFEKRMSSFEESGPAYNETAPEPEPPNTSPTVHPIYSEVKKTQKKKPVQTAVPPPMPPVHVEPRTQTTYIRPDEPPNDQITVREERSRPVPPPEVPETYKQVKARHAQQQQHDVSPPREVHVHDTSPPPPPPPILNDEEVPRQTQPYDPQLRYEYSPKERTEIMYVSQGETDHTQAQVVTPPYSLPLSVEREEIITPREKRPQKVVAAPARPRFSPTYEESPLPPPPQESARSPTSPTSPTIDYTEVPIYPNIKPSHQNLTSPPRRVPSQPNDSTNAVTTPPAPPPILNEDTYQKKPARSLHPSVTTTTTTKEITRSSAPPEGSQRDSTTPVRHSYAYTEMTPGEAQALYATMTKPESAKGGETTPVQEVKTTRHRIEVTRVTHIDTTNVRPYDRPDISNIRFADSDPPTESHIWVTSKVTWNELNQLINSDQGRIHGDSPK